MTQSGTKLRSVYVIRIPLCNGPAFEWNLEHLSGNLSEKDAFTVKKFKILGKQLSFSKYLMLSCKKNS